MAFDPAERAAPAELAGKDAGALPARAEQLLTWPA